MMKRICFKAIGAAAAIVSLLLTASCGDDAVSISSDVLMDKIKGAWAGQTFGVTYGGPTEFKFNGRMIDDSVRIDWSDDACRWWFDNDSGLYDDVYMDLTFVDMIERYGIDVSQDVIADAFAHAGFKLWHANQAARYNILNGIKAPESGFWKNNPHSDDIDFQIEADFAGIMSPGMPVAAAEICDKVGHIMCYGDGWYGGVYVAAMYSLAFISDDVAHIVKEALKMIPEESDFSRCISDVIRWCGENEDWKDTWRLLMDKWSEDTGCPKSVDRPVSIEAKLNAAYVVMGLLYGNKDFERTMDIATRCGNDSDCNPSTAAGILGTIYGYSRIPDKWTRAVEVVDSRNFDHTDISLQKAYDMSFRHAVAMTEANGGRVSGDKVIIRVQKPEPVRYEKGFEGLELAFRDNVKYSTLEKQFTYDFEGCGIVLDGKLKNLGDCPDSYVAELSVILDGKDMGIQRLPADFITRKKEYWWNYDLTPGPHTVAVRWLNPIDSARLILDNVIVYRKK